MIPMGEVHPLQSKGSITVETPQTHGIFDAAIRQPAASYGQKEPAYNIQMLLLASILLGCATISKSLLTKFVLTSSFDRPLLLAWASCTVSCLVLLALKAGRCLILPTANRDEMKTIGIVAFWAALSLGLANLSLSATSVVLSLTLRAMAPAFVVMIEIMGAAEFCMPNRSTQGESTHPPVCSFFWVSLGLLVTGSLLVASSSVAEKERAERLDNALPGIILGLVAALAGALKLVLTQDAIKQLRDHLGSPSSFLWIEVAISLWLLPWVVASGELSDLARLWGTLSCMEIMLLIVVSGLSAFRFWCQMMVQTYSKSALMVSSINVGAQACTVFVASSILPLEDQTTMFKLGVVFSLTGLLTYSGIEYVGMAGKESISITPNPGNFLPQLCGCCFPFPYQPLDTTTTDENSKNGSVPRTQRRGSWKACVPYIVLFFLAFIAAVWIGSTHQPASFNPPHNATVADPECRRVAFFKTHKTGSTTVGNIVWRHGKALNASVVPSSHIMVSNEHDDMRNIYSEYDIIYYHVSYDGEWKWYVRPKVDSKRIIQEWHDIVATWLPGAVKITIVREPLKRLQSWAHYYELGNITDSNNGTVCFQRGSSIHCPENLASALPMQIHDLAIWNSDDLNDFMDAPSFHLVMVLERFEESLLALHANFCTEWSLSDMLSLRLNHCPTTTVTNHLDRCGDDYKRMSSVSLKTLKEALSLDYELYYWASNQLDSLLAVVNGSKAILSSFDEETKAIQKFCVDENNQSSVCIDLKTQDICYEAEALENYKTLPCAGIIT